MQLLKTHIIFSFFLVFSFFFHTTEKCFLSQSCCFCILSYCVILQTFFFVQLDFRYYKYIQNFHQISPNYKKYINSFSLGQMIADDETISCRYCDKQILKKNYELHKVRCGVLNRARRINTMPQEKQKEEGRKKINFDDVYRQLQELEIKEEEKQIKKVSPKKQRLETESFLREERIPCHICGHLQSLSQLDTHSQNCKGEGMICDLCEQFVPLQRIEMHQIICPKKKAIKKNVHFQNPKQVRQINKQEERNKIPEIIQKRRIPRRQARNEFEQMRQMRELISNMSRLGKQNREGLPESHIRKLISFTYKPHALNNDSCSICYCNYQQGEEILLLPCAHPFHAVCVKQWLKNNCKCPYCKEKVKFRK